MTAQDLRTYPLTKTDSLLKVETSVETFSAQR